MNKKRICKDCKKSIESYCQCHLDVCYGHNHSLLGKEIEGGIKMKKENIEKLKEIQKNMQSSIDAKYGGEVLRHNLPFDVKAILDVLIDELKAE